MKPNYYTIHKNKKPKLKSRNKRFVDLKKFVAWCKDFPDLAKGAVESLRSIREY